MEQKPAVAQSNGMVHGALISQVPMRAGSLVYHNFVVKLDNGKKFVLVNSANLAKTAAPLAIGDHVMVNPGPAFLITDSRVNLPLARMWRRANGDEIPAAPASAAPAFGKKEPLPEPAAQAAVQEMRTKHFSKNSDVARAIERELSAAVMTDAKAFILYDPLDSGYPQFLCLVRNKDDLDWAADTIGQLSGSRVGFVRNIGERICGFSDNMTQSSFDRCLARIAVCLHGKDGIAVIPIPGLSRKEGWMVEIENEVLSFCIYDAQLPAL